MIPAQLFLFVLVFEAKRSRWELRSQLRLSAVGRRPDKQGNGLRDVEDAVPTEIWEVAAEVFRISLQYQKLHSLQLSNLHLEDVGHLLWTRGPRDEYEVVRWRRKLWKCSDRLKFAFENLSSFSFYYIHNPLLKIREFPGPGGRSVTTQWGKPKGIWMDLAHRLGGHACLIIFATHIVNGKTCWKLKMISLLLHCFSLSDFPCVMLPQ